MKDGKNTVLFVDDEKNVLSALKRGLMREPYLKFFATSGLTALDIMKEEEIDVIVTDMRMPGMTGLELLKEVNIVSPKTIKIVLSGYTQLPQILITINEVNIFKFITKPWDMETEFKGVVKEAITYYNTIRENEVLKKSIEKKNVLYSNLLKKNDEKMSFMKKDIGNISELISVFSNHIFNKIRTGTVQDIEHGLKIFEEGMELIEKYLLYLPTIHKHFDFKDFEKDTIQTIALSKGLDKKELENMFVFSLNPDVYYHGDYFGLKYIVELIMMYSGYQGNLKDCKIGVSSTLIEEGEITGVEVPDIEANEEVRIVISLPNPKFDNLKKIEMVSIIFTQLIRFVGGKIQFSNQKGKYVFIIRVNLLRSKYVNTL